VSRGAEVTAGIRLRAAEPSDLEALARLEAVCFADPWQAADLAPWLNPERGAVRIAQRVGADRPVGAAVFALLPGEAELLRVAVEPALRRQGVARELLLAALAELVRGGRPDCFLEVRAGNTAALALYERLAFHTVALRRHYYPDGEDALICRRHGGTLG
jgi:ribosomal-protein-alanine N-acetyltransferase